MANLRKLQTELLSDGKITSQEVSRIKAHVESDGALDHDDVKFLVELTSQAEWVCQEFDQFFFPVLREAILEDGRVTMDEQYQLLRMLYADGHVRPAEKEFIRDLYASVDEKTPEFTELCETALASPERDWCVGGKARQSEADAATR